MEAKMTTPLTDICQRANDAFLNGTNYGRPLPESLYSASYFMIPLMVGNLGATGNLARKLAKVGESALRSASESFNPFLIDPPTREPYKFPLYASEKIFGAISQYVERTANSMAAGNHRRVLEVQALMHKLQSVSISTPLGHESDETLEATISSTNPLQDEAVATEHLRRLVGNYVGKLPERERQAITMRFFEEKPFDEIASYFGVTRNMANAMMSRALRRLKSLLSKDSELRHYLP